MNHAELVERLRRATPTQAPGPEVLLLHAFPEPLPRSKPKLQTQLATAALFAASLTPLWLRPAKIDRERTKTLIDATTELTELCAQDWKEAHDGDR